MSEQDQIQRTFSPITVDRLIHDLQDLGLKHGDTVIVHSSLSALGWVNGGAVTVIKALLGIIDSEGNICVPAHSSNITDPANWSNPPMPESWIQTIRALLHKGLKGRATRSEPNLSGNLGMRAT